MEFEAQFNKKSRTKEGYPIIELFVSESVWSETDKLTNAIFNLAQSMRGEIKKFVEAMEKEMSRHDEYKKDSWKEMGVGRIRERIEDEFQEFCKSKDDESKASELVDIANFCMMGWNHLTDASIRKCEAPHSWRGEESKV